MEPAKRVRWQGVAVVLGAVASGILQALAFAPFGLADAAWFCLLPLLIALRFVEPRDAFRIGWLSGCTFWLITLFWLTRVTYFGWSLLAMYCAIYHGLFAWGVALWLRRFGNERLVANMGLMLYGSLLWAGLEWLRSTFGTGFAWNPLGVSQYENLAIIQIAAWGGVYAVSALMVWLNLAMGTTMLRYITLRGRWGRRAHPELIAGFLLLALVFTFGMKRAGVRGEAGVQLRAALVQTGIPQDEKWDQEKVDLIYRRLTETTLQALTTDPDLVIWPETALPDDVRSSPPSYELVRNLATNGAPILVGSMDTAWEDDGPRYFNSSFLFDERGVLIGQYDKIHLVAFGEFVPFRHALPFMKAMTPIEASFDAGTNVTVFSVPDSGARFSVLICFEDTVAKLAREAVKKGARLLVNQTNDAWFDPLWASWQHMAHSVLRAVENQVPVVRSANTGVTCHIDSMGRIRSILEDHAGGTRFAGFRTADVALAPPDMQLTFYTRHGDTPVIIALVGAALATQLLRKKRPGMPSLPSA